jgi:hypothetical protein
MYTANNYKSSWTLNLETEELIQRQERKRLRKKAGKTKLQTSSKSLSQPCLDLSHG